MGTKQSTDAGQHNFAQIPSVQMQRSAFDRSCGLKTTFDAGMLIPIFCDEALPGDTMSMHVTAFTRLATPLHPIMDNLYMDTFFFAVPIRLIWSNWERFNGSQDDPGDSTTFLVPQLTTGTGGLVAQDLGDYMGIPIAVDDLTHSAFWHRAYNLIWNEWFRDENLQDAASTSKTDGPDNKSSYPLRRRGKRHDYFTSALPFPQKGPDVGFGLGDTAPFVPDPGFINIQPVSGSVFPSMDVLNGSDERTMFQAVDNIGMVLLPGAPSGSPLKFVQTGMTFDREAVTGVTDLTAATASTINAIREAFQIQRLFERDARGGTRYTEILHSHFGVVSPDARLQRPEYLGGGSAPITVQPVPQTSQSDTSPQGNLAAFGVGQMSAAGFNKSFTEHCVILGLLATRADLNYQQGLERQFSRRTRFDFYWPALANLGEQPILNKELWAQGPVGGDDDDEVFGYQERFAEYRYKPSLITGKMRTEHPQTLDTWHLAQFFGTLPTLNAEFIEEDPPIERVVAVPSEPDFLLDVFFKYRCARPMPTYSVPGMIDHF